MCDYPPACRQAKSGPLTFKLAIALSLVMFMGCSSPETTDSISEMSVSFLPVGGYAALFSFPDGGTMLVDTGDVERADQLVKNVRSRMLGDQFVYKFLLFFGWQPRLDWLVLSDFSPERTGGVRKILENFRIWKIYLPYDFGNMMMVQSPRINNLRFLLGVENSPILLLSRKNGIELYRGQKGVDFFVISPGKPLNSVLESGLCMRLTYDRMRFLLSAALSGKEQERICGYMADKIRADVSYLDAGIGDKFLNLVNPSSKISKGDEAHFITDGIMLEKINNKTTEARNIRRRGR